MVSAADGKNAENPAADDGLVCAPVGVPLNRLADPQYYLETSAAIIAGMRSGEMKPLDAQRQLEAMAEACLTFCGRAIEDVAKDRVDPFVRFVSLMESEPKALAEIEAAVRHIDDLRAPPAVKKKWLSLIARTRRLQVQCRADPAKFWVYVGREDAQAGVFKMAPCHLHFFEVWNDETCMNSLTMAPPGHAKTTCLRGQTLWEIGTYPHLRFLLLYDTADKVAKEIPILKGYLRSRRFQALFPDIRVLDRKDQARCTSDSFAVCRVNALTREPTVEGAGIQSRINGNGYNRIHADDICPPEVRWQPGVRRSLAATWFGVVEERIRDHPRVRARIRMICTPWHEEDTAGLIEKDVQAGRLRNWALNIEDNRIRDDRAGLAVPIWDKGGMFTSAYFEEKKRWPQRYNCNYRLNPRMDNTQIIKHVHFYNSVPAGPYTRPHDLEVLQAVASAERWLSIDPAATNGSGRRTSRHGAIEAVITQRGYAFVTNCWIHAIGPVELQEWVVERICTAPAPGYSYLLIEASAAMKYGVSLMVDNVRTAVAKRKVRMPDVLDTDTRFGHRASMSKEHRLSECAGHLQNGLVRLAGEWYVEPRSQARRLGAIANSNIEELRDLLINYDGGTQGTDVIDAVTQFILVNQDRIADPATPLLPVARAAAISRTAGAVTLNKAWQDEILRLQKPEEEEDDELAMFRAKYGRPERISA